MSAAVTLKISADSWKNATAHSLKVGKATIVRIDDSIQNSRFQDPLPLLRDACIKETNDRIHAYVRAVRAVVLQLRKKLAALNEEIKSLTRAKESLEKALDHVRKDVAVNSQSMELRTLRPDREQVPDAADQLLQDEHAHLLSMKRLLESHLRKTQQQLQALAGIRFRLTAVIQERSRATDLICHSMRSTVAVSHFPAHHEKRSTSSQGGKNFWPSFMLQKSKASPTAQRSLGSMRNQRSYSAPLPLQLHRESTRSREKQDKDKRSSTNKDKDLQVGSTNAYSPECHDAIRRASEEIFRSRELRKELSFALEQAQLSQQAMHSTVNEGITRKLAETVTLTHHLQLSGGESRVAMHRTLRFLEAQEKGLGYLQGPVSCLDVTAAEKLDRPLVRMLQRHPGTDLPEQSHLEQAHATYANTLQTTEKNLMLLQLADKRLKEDLRDKKIASEIDSNVVRLRRRKANHRWVMDNTNTIKPCSTKLTPKATDTKDSTSSSTNGTGSKTKH